MVPGRPPDRVRQRPGRQRRDLHDALRRRRIRSTGPTTRRRTTTSRTGSRSAATTAGEAPRTRDRWCGWKWQPRRRPGSEPQQARRGGLPRRDDRAPGARSSSCAEASLSSAVSGWGAASPTRTRLPTVVTETTRTARWFWAEPLRSLARRGERDLPRVDADRDRALAGLGAEDRPAAVERTRVRPSSPACARAGEHDGAGEVGHERRRGRGRELGRRALLDHAPAVDHADAVAEQRGLGEVVGHEQRGHAGLGQDGGELAPAAARERVSSADSGSSSSSACGRRASARATATRWRSPPDSVRGRSSARWATPKRSSSSSARCLALAAVEAAQRVGDVLPRAQVGEQRVLLEHVAAAAPLGRDVDAARGVEPHLLAAATRARAPGARARRRRAAPRSSPRRTARRARGSAGRDLERDVERERPEPRGGLNAQHRRATPSR